MCWKITIEGLDEFQRLRQAQDPDGLWTCRSQRPADYKLSALPSLFFRRFGRFTRHLPRSGDTGVDGFVGSHGRPHAVPKGS